MEATKARTTRNGWVRIRIGFVSFGFVSFVAFYIGIRVALAGLTAGGAPV